MRQGLISVVHSKLLRLNATVVSYLSPGFIINVSKHVSSLTVASR